MPPKPQPRTVTHEHVVLPVHRRAVRLRGHYVRGEMEAGVGIISRILRIFPRRTNATPDDVMSWVGDPGLFPVECDEVHISVAFTYDRPEAERLKAAYDELYPVVKIGGPGMGDRGGDFVPGRYLKPGYVITSRGCPNRCWFCYVWKRDGDIRELPITEGWNVQDDNLLACSEKHICEVAEMLRCQPRRPVFSGGLESKRVTQEIANLIASLNPAQIFTAYDKPDDYDPLFQSGEYWQTAGMNRDKLYCYVLIGYPGDEQPEAERRLRDSWDAGYIPFAMLYRDDNGEQNNQWRIFQRQWARPAIIKAICKQEAQ